MLLGREAERGRCRRLLEAARAGRGEALLVRGEPGIGKTVLLRAARAEAADFRVLTARPVEGESRLAFAALGDLVRPILARVDELPGPQAAALRAALALGPPANADRFAAYTAVLSLLQATAREGRLLAVVDDAHWLDDASAEGLAFAARRLGGGIALLMALRTSEPDPFRDSGLPELRLEGLPEPAARELLVRSALQPLAEPVSASLLEAAAGNPLALVELPRALTARQGRGEAPLDAPLRAGGVVAGVFRRSLERLPAPCRRALAVGAVAGQARMAELAPALAALGLQVGDLAPAEHAELVAVDGERLRFRHPLLRAAVLQLTPAPEARAVHRALASVLDPEREAERRAWHLAAAAVGPEEEAAQALEAAAAVAGARTGYAAAAGALQGAAALSADPQDRARRLLAGAGAALMAGTPQHAAAMLEEAAPLAGEGPLRNAVGQLRAVARLVTGPVDEAHALLLAEAEAASATDPASATRMLAEATFSLCMAAKCRAALATARRAAVLSERADQLSQSRARMVLNAALILAGEGRLSRELGLPDASIPSDPLAWDTLVPVAVLPFCWIERFADAERMAVELVKDARRAGAAGRLAFPLASRSELGFRTGRPRAGLADAAESIRLLEDTGQHPPLGYALSMAAVNAAVLGDEQACRAFVARVGAVEGMSTAGSLRVYLGHARGLLELGLARPEAAVAAFAPLPGLVREHELRDPSVVPWRADYVEALALTGRTAQAWRQLTVLGEEAYRSGSAWARAATSRCRGLLDAHEPERHFREALGWHAQVPDMAFERARTELCFGAWLRRAGRRRDARELLEKAGTTLREMGARGWGAQAADELAAAGRRGGPGPTRDDALTPRERQVALAVSEGLSNREAGARLFLSEKTVERHLGAVYRKLGLRSRVQLARAMAPGAPDRGPGGPAPSAAATSARPASSTGSRA